MSTDILPSPELDPPSSASRSPLRLVLSGVVVVLVLALIGGVTVAVRGLSGGGSQPEDALPGGAFAFAKVDLDPSAGQKINALRFLRKFPALRDKVSLDADLREALFESVAEEAGWGELDFDKDVAPWLGSRVAIAAYPPAEGDTSRGAASSGSGSGVVSSEAVPVAFPAAAPSTAPAPSFSAETFNPDEFGETFNPDEFGETFNPDEFGETFNPEEFGESFNPEDFEEEFGTDGDLDPEEFEEPGAMFGGFPTVVVALQVTDAAKARAGLDKLIAASPDAPDPGVVIQDGYALLAQDQHAADKAAKDAKGGVLADDENFSSDLAALGDGVASAWVDMDGVSALAGLTGFVGAGALGLGGINSAGDGGAGRTSWVLKFDGADALEVRGAVTGAKPIAGSDQKLTGFADLPEDSVVAFGLAGGDKMVPNIFEQLRTIYDDMGAAGPEGGFDEMVADAERELGIELPDDVAVLLGSNFLASMYDDEKGSTAMEVGARVTTDGARAAAVVDQISEAARRHGEDSPIVRQQIDDGLIVATSQEQVDRLAQQGGLGARDAVKKALPDVGEATAAVWVDLRSLMNGFMGAEGVDENLEPLEGVGMTIQMHEDGSADYRLRLVTD